MGATQTRTIVEVILGGISQQGYLRDLCKVAGQPGFAVVQLIRQSAYKFDKTTIQKKLAQVKLNGVPYIVGYPLLSDCVAEDDTVSIKIVDKRWLVNKDWVGRRHLPPNGIRWLGSDIIFNLDGKRNKDKDALQFVYERGNVTDPENCAVIEATYWTYADIWNWVWREYVDDVAAPTLPVTGGLNRSAGEIDLTGMPVGVALDYILSFTECAWTIDANGNAVVFNVHSPRTTRTLKFNDPAEKLPVTSYSTDYPVKFRVITNQEDVATNIEIVGGKTIREIMATEDDFYDEALELNVEPVASYPPIDVVPPGGGAIVREFRNYAKNMYYRHGFKRDRYETHGAGRNIRRKDNAKPILGELMIGRNRDGGYVNAESECNFLGSSPTWLLGQQYHAGGDIDTIRGEIDISYYDTIYAPDAPKRFTHAIETEEREFVTSSATHPTLPKAVHRAVLRGEFVHKTREAVKIPVPVQIVRICTSGGCTYSVTEAIDLTDLLAAGATRDYPDPAGGPFSGTPDMETFTVTLPAGVIEDAIGPLNEVKSFVDGINRVDAVQIEGAFPYLTSLDVGDLIVTSPANAYGSTGLEVVIGLRFSERTQSLEFIATNYVSVNAIGAAQAFVNRVAYRTPL
jgi:hypothetical protein